MLCLGLASRYGLDDLARLALRQLVASPVDELKANSHIDSLLVGHLFAMRTARVERLCQIIFGLEGSIVIPCKKHKHTSRVWVQTAVQAMNREPSFEAFLRALDEPISCHCEPPEITAKLEDEFKVTESECDLLSRNELTDEGSLVRNGVRDLYIHFPCSWLPFSYSLVYCSGILLLQAEFYGSPDYPRPDRRRGKRD